MAAERLEKHLNPVKVLLALEDALNNDDVILVADGGDFVGTAAYTLRPRGPLSWLDPGAFGTLGVGAGFALGAKLCCPEKQVWIIYGDGASGYSLVECDTFVRHKAPVISLIGNDAAWMQMARDQIPRFGTDVACSLQFSHYEKVYEAFGGKGYHLDAGDDEDENLKNVFRSAIEDYRNGQSVLINVLIGKTKFREGSISV